MYSPDDEKTNGAVGSTDKNEAVGESKSGSFEEMFIKQGMQDVTDTIKHSDKTDESKAADEPKSGGNSPESKGEAPIKAAVVEAPIEAAVAESGKPVDTATESEPAEAIAVPEAAVKPEKPVEADKKAWALGDYITQLKNGVLDQNPILVQLLGTCPTLATTTSVINAFGMGIAATAVLVCSNLLISLLRRIIPKQIRIAAFIVIISGFVTAVEMLIKAYFPALNKSLGVFIPLIVVNCIILARAEAFASKNPPLPSLVDGFAMGLGFTLALVVLGAIRELLGTGGIAGISILGASYKPALLFIMPPGAFITLGFIIALVQKARMTSDRRKAYAESGVTRAQLKEERRAEKLRARAEKDEKLRAERENINAEAEEERELAEAAREGAKK